MQAQAVKKTFCTTRDAAQLLGVSVGTIQLWVESGLLEAWKTAGGHRRVMRDSVLGLLHQTPTAKPPALPNATPPRVMTVRNPVHQPKRRLNALVIDDSPAALRLYKARMAVWNLKPVVTTNENAIAALMQIGQNPLDLLVADLQMPGLDGFGLLRLLADMPEFSDTTILAVTNLSAADMAQRGGLPQAIEVLPKPISFERLQEIADGIAVRKQLERRAN